MLKNVQAKKCISQHRAEKCFALPIFFRKTKCHGMIYDLNRIQQTFL